MCFSQKDSLHLTQIWVFRRFLHFEHSRSIKSPFTVRDIEKQLLIFALDILAVKGS